MRLNDENEHLGIEVLRIERVVSLERFFSVPHRVDIAPLVEIGTRQQLVRLERTLTVPARVDRHPLLRDSLRQRVVPPILVNVRKAIERL